MDENSSEQSGDEASDQLRAFIERQLNDLEAPGNVHGVRERLFGNRWLDGIEVEDLPADVYARVRAEVDRAWSALSRYPWDLHGAQQALQAALEGLEGK